MTNMVKLTGKRTNHRENWIHARPKGNKAKSYISNATGIKNGFFVLWIDSHNLTHTHTHICVGAHVYIDICNIYIF